MKSEEVYVMIYVMNALYGVMKNGRNVLDHI